MSPPEGLLDSPDFDQIVERALCRSHGHSCEFQAESSEWAHGIKRVPHNGGGIGESSGPLLGDEQVVHLDVMTSGGFESTDVPGIKNLHFDRGARRRSE